MANAFASMRICGSTFEWYTDTRKTPLKLHGFVNTTRTFRSSLHKQGIQLYSNNLFQLPHAGDTSDREMETGRKQKLTASR